MEQYIKALKIPFFRGIFMRDTLPKASTKKECGILNLDSNEGNGTHWTCWFKPNSTHCYYFDSYGLPAPLEFDKYIKTDIFYSSLNVQRDHQDICGHLCLVFLQECISEKRAVIETLLKLNRILS